MLTSRYHNGRTGANLSETTLSISNINASQFGRLYSYPVDGAVLAQALYGSGVVIHGVSHNVSYVATMNDKVYAFDADTNAAPLGFVTLQTLLRSRSCRSPTLSRPTGGDLPNIGIESAPVIDAVSGTMYRVARTKENGVHVQRLHALDITTGLEKGASPVHSYCLWIRSRRPQRRRYFQFKDAESTG